MTATTSTQLTYLEDTGLDGKKLYTAKERIERFRHYLKRIHKMDIKQISVDDTTPTGEPWYTKEQEIRQDLICGAAIQNSTRTRQYGWDTRSHMTYLDRIKKSGSNQYFAKLTPNLSEKTDKMRQLLCSKKGTKGTNEYERKEQKMGWIEERSINFKNL